MATLYFAAEIYREKITSDFLAVQGRGCLGGALEFHALCFKAGLNGNAVFILGEEVSICLGGW